MGKTMTVQFDIERDSTLIASGTHFWCSACLVARPLASQSSDPHYCKDCCEVLEHEASLLNPRNRPRWLPETLKGKTAVQNVNKVSGDVSHNMSTVNSKNIDLDKLTFRPPKEKPGPKVKDLPRELIRELATASMGSKSIASKLTELGYNTVSYKTIQRRLQEVMAL